MTHIPNSCGKQASLLLKVKSAQKKFNHAAGALTNNTWKNWNFHTGCEILMRSVVEPQIEQVNQRKPQTKYEQGCFLAKFFSRTSQACAWKIERDRKIVGYCLASPFRWNFSKNNYFCKCSVILKLIFVLFTKLNYRNVSKRGLLR